MRNKKWLKKTAAILLAGAMVCTAGAWTGAEFAAEVQASETDVPDIDLEKRGSLTISKTDGQENPLPGAGFKLYKVMSLTKSKDGVYGYIPEPAFNEILNLAQGNLDKLSAQQIEKLVLQLAEKAKEIEATTGEQVTGETGSITFNDLEVGYYLVVETKVPNGYIAGKPFLVDIPRTNNEGTGWTYDVTATPKNYSTSIVKEIDKTVTGEKVENDGTVAVGDYIPFKITTQTPNYADEMYEDKTVVFTVTDVMSDGLTIVDYGEYLVKVYVNGEEAPSSAYTKRVGNVSGDDADLRVMFDHNFLKSDAGSNKEVVITYFAQVNEKAVAGVDQNKNTASLSYTNQDGTDSSTTGEKVHVYTFDIAVKKFTGEGGNGNEALKGAIFELYEGADVETGTKLPGTYETSDEGKVTITSLDEGTYWLVETKAPAGYTRLTNPIKIEIIADKVDEVAKTGEFNLKVDGQTIEAASGEFVSYADTEQGVSQVAVENHKGFSLPQTGGMGIVLFLAVGVAGIVVVSVLLTRKSKDAK